MYFKQNLNFKIRMLAGNRYSLNSSVITHQAHFQEKLLLVYEYHLPTYLCLYLVH